MNPEQKPYPPSPQLQQSPTAPVEPVSTYQPGSGSLPSPDGQASAASTQAGPSFANAPSIDYLNQIATPSTEKTHSKVAIIALVGGVLLAVLFAILLISRSQGPDLTAQALTLNNRINTLQEVATAQQKHLSENDIVEANATLGAALTTMSSDLSTLVPSKKEDTKKKDTVETAYKTALLKTLDDAYQRGTLDRTYPVQMTYELTLLRGMVVKLQNNTKESDVRSFCEASLKNIDIILKLYADFDATKS